MDDGRTLQQNALGINLFGIFMPFFDTLQAFETHAEFSSIEITWRKMVDSVCLEPASTAM